METEIEEHVKGLSNKALNQQLSLKQIDHRGYHELSELRKLLIEHLMKEPILDGKGVVEYVKSLTNSELKDNLTRNVVNTTGIVERSELQDILIKSLRENHKIDQYIKSLKSSELLEQLENNDVYHFAYREKSELQDLLKNKIAQNRQGGNIRIVAFGHTGDGKSYTCNSILMNDDAFDTSVSATSVTDKCSNFKANVLGHDVVVVDTPGLFDTRELTLNKTLNELGRCLLLASPGPHVFIYVTKIGERFSPEKQHTLKKYLEVFGHECQDFMIVVFSGADNLKKRMTLETYIDTAPEEIRQLIKNCKGRYASFDNTVEKSSETNKDQVKKLLLMMNKLITDNFYRVYTSSLLQEAKRKVKEREAVIRKEEAKKKVQQRLKIEKEEQDRIDAELEAERRKHELRLQQQDHAIQVQRRKQEEERQRLLQLEEEMLVNRLQMETLESKLQALVLQSMLEDEMEDTLDSDDDSSCNVM